MDLFDKYNEQHRRLIEEEATQLYKYFSDITEIALIVRPIFSKVKGVFKFNDFKAVDKRITNLFKKRSSLFVREVEILTEKHWALADAKNEKFLNSLTRKGVPIFKRNAEGLQAFRTRRHRQLSQRVWKYHKQAKQEIEMAIDTAIKDGVPATKLATQLKSYLRNPDKLFRRYREANGSLQLSKNALAYHPGKGVYRSSSKNALRLARSEVNMAYRKADLDRFNQLDFVIGYEVKRSHNPHPCSVCDSLKGRYPKDFVFLSWHPNCLCYIVPILISQDDFITQQKKYIETGKKTPTKEHIKDIPDNFKKWVNENSDRITRAKELPYFLKDNEKYWQNHNH